MSRSIGGQVFDYYVDPVSGSDVAAGTLSAPLATLSRADTLIGASTGKRVGLKRGTTLRNDPVSFGAANTYVGAYGSGAMPQSLGSSQTAVASFTKVGNLYSIAHTVNPFTLALVDGSGNATKLYMASTSNGNSAVDPATEGEWTFFPATHATPNLLKFYTTATITGYQVEVPQGGSALTGIAFTADSCTINGISVRYWSGSGITVGGDFATITANDASYNGRDGIDGDPQSASATITYNTVTDNGQRWAGGGGPGDGISLHSAFPNAASGVIRYNTIKRNTQTGVGNQIGCDAVVEYNYLEDNYYDFNVYNVADALIGSHNIQYNKVRHTVNRSGSTWFNTSGTVGAANEASAIRVRNNTVVFDAGITNNIAATIQGFTNTFDSNIVKLPATVSNAYQIVTGTIVTATNNTANGQGTAVWRGAPFVNPTTESGTLTTDPLLTNPASGDFTLQAGSPCIDAGTNWGQTQDYTGKAITGTPDRGAYER